MSSTDLVMEKHIKINLLNLEAYETTPSTPITRPSFLITLAALIISGGIILTATTVFSYNTAKQPLSPLNKAVTSIFFPSFPQFDHLLGNKLKGEQEDRINVLLLGIGGKNHDGPYLSDTIIIASIQPSTKKVAFISIPRDLLINMPPYGWRKINDADAFGEIKEAGKGADFTKQVIEQTFSIPIHYYFRADFSAFEKIIDLVGGVTVTVDHPFTDYQYPTERKKYQVVSFASGAQLMDGATALKFVRSRHSGMNNEGSDFARSRRQQKVLIALREKLLSKEILFKPGTIAEIFTTLKENIATDLSIPELIQFSQYAKKVDEGSFTTVVFNEDLGNVLTADTVDGAYVLRPRDGTYDEMKKLITGAFDPLQGDANKKQLIQEKPHVSIKNGTLAEGLATKVANRLKKNGYSVDFIGNARQRNYQKSELVDFTHAQKNESLQQLKKILSLHQESTYVSNTQELISLPLSDFLLIIGDDINKQYLDSQ